MVFRNLTLRLTAFSALIIGLILVASATATYFIVQHDLQNQLSHDLQITVSSFQQTERYKVTFASVGPELSPAKPPVHSDDESLQEEETERELLAQMPYPVFLLDGQGATINLISGQLQNAPPHPIRDCLTREVRRLPSPENQMNARSTPAAAGSECIQYRLFLMMS